MYVHEIGAGGRGCCCCAAAAAALTTPRHFLRSVSSLESRVVVSGNCRCISCCVLPCEGGVDLRVRHVPGIGDMRLLT